MQRNTSPLIVIVGPTGSGKTDLALKLAREFSGEIVGCDSIQVYRHLDIGSAKPVLSERSEIPHHLIDILDLDQELTAGAYARLARPVLADVTQAGSMPIVAGGTGLYLRALLDGLSPAPARDEKLRQRLGAIAARRPGSLHRLLANRDEAAALRIHPNDHQKLIRALELAFLTAQPASRLQRIPRATLQGFRVLKIGLDPGRQLLRERLDRRTERMFRGGLIEETAAILRDGFSPDLKPLQSLGYRQALQILLENRSLEDAIQEAQAKTRQYAKRQMTWFRQEQNVSWLQGFGTESAIYDQSRALVRSFLPR